MLTETRRVDPPSAPHEIATRFRGYPASPAAGQTTWLPVGRPAADADSVLRALYAEHGAALLAFAERYTRDRGRAEDIVQETFLRAWRHLPRLLADERPVRAWLLQVARRLLIDADRASRARPALTGENPSREPTVDGGFDQLLDQTVLADAMQQLSPAHRQIVIETYLLGTPMHVAAARLGVPAGTARSRLHYALSRLRQHLEPDCVAA